MGTPWRLFLAGLSLPLALLSVGAADLRLADGSVLKGEIVSVTPAEVVISTTHGPLRVATSDLTPESRSALGIGGAADLGFYQRRVAELESELTRLRTENQGLRQQLAGGQRGGKQPPAPTEPGGITPNTRPPQTAPGASGERSQYWLSSSGKRHNGSCRYFHGSSGHACGPHDGVACKVCGG